MNNFRITLIIPCFNEAGNIEQVTNKVIHVLEKYNDYELIFIDDGSTDDTLQTIKSGVQKHEKIKYLSFSRNFGQQHALKAGLDYATGDCVISMDADLQHPPELIDTMIQKWQEGYDVIYTVRKDDKTIPFFKRKASQLFYKLINKISKTEIPDGTADFRLMDKKVVKVMKDIDESFLFMRGLVSWIGFKQYALEYTPQPRFSGTTKYSLRQMLMLALVGITSFSIRPLHLATILGLTLAFLSILYGIYAVGVTVFTNRTVSGWASVIVSVLFIGSIQLLMLGIIGEYLGKLFIESKKRPNYIIKEKNIEG